MAVDWNIIRAAFMTTPEEPPNLSELERKFGVSRTSIRRQAKELDHTGRNWYDYRSEHRKEVATQIDEFAKNQVVKHHEGTLKSMIDQSKLLEARLNKFLSDEKNFEEMEVKQFNALYKNYVQLNKAIISIIKDAKEISGGSNNDKKITLSVPLKFINVEGRKWLREQLDNLDEVNSNYYIRQGILEEDK